jgi:hypothetical protein
MPLQFPTMTIRKRGELRKSVVGEHKAIPLASGHLNDDNHKASKISNTQEQSMEALPTPAVESLEIIGAKNDKLHAEEVLATGVGSDKSEVDKEDSATVEPIAKIIEESENGVLPQESLQEIASIDEEKTLADISPENATTISDQPEVTSKPDLDPSLEETQNEIKSPDGAVQLPGHIKYHILNNTPDDDTDRDGDTTPRALSIHTDPFSDEFAADYQSIVSVVQQTPREHPEISEENIDKSGVEAADTKSLDVQADKPSDLQSPEIIESAIDSLETSDTVHDISEALLDTESLAVLETASNSSEPVLEADPAAGAAQDEQKLPVSEIEIAPSSVEQDTASEFEFDDNNIEARTKEQPSSEPTNSEAITPVILHDAENNHRRVESQTSLLNFSAVKASQIASIGCVEVDQANSPPTDNERTLSSKGSRRSLLGGLSAIASFASSIRGSTTSPASSTSKEATQIEKPHVPGAFEKSPSITDVEDSTNDINEKNEEEFDEAAFQPRDLDEELRQASFLAVATAKPDVMSYLVTEDITPPSKIKTDREDSNKNEKGDEDEEKMPAKEPVNIVSSIEYVESLARAGIIVHSQSVEGLSEKEIVEKSGQATLLPRNDSASSLHTQHHIGDIIEHTQEQNLHDAFDSEVKTEETIIYHPVTPSHSRDNSLDGLDTGDHNSMPSTPADNSGTQSPVRITHGEEPEIMSSSPAVTRLHINEFGPEPFENMNIPLTETKQLALSPAASHLDFTQGQPLPSPRLEMKDEAFGAPLPSPPLLSSKASLSQLSRSTTSSPDPSKSADTPETTTEESTLPTATTFQQRRSVFESAAAATLPTPISTPPPPSSLATPLTGKGKPASPSFARPPRRGRNGKGKGGRGGRNANFDEGEVVAETQ